MDATRSVTVAQSVTVADERGKPAYELTVRNGHVQYAIVEYSTEEDARTSFRGELQETGTEA
jgi:uncharacterized protein YpmB